MGGNRKGLPPQEAPSKFISSDADRVQSSRRLRDHGASSAFAAASILYRDAALDSIHRRAELGIPFSADEVHADIEAAVGDFPISGGPSALGGAFLIAKNAGVIVPAGFTTSSRRSRHRGLQRLWTGVVAS